VPCLGLLLDLALDELLDVGVVDVEDDHLGCAAGLAAGFDDAGEGVDPRMKESGPLAVPPPERVSMEPRMLERLEPAPEPHLKSIPSVLARVRMESSESLTELMKQAEHWGLVYPVTENSTRPVAGFQCQFCASGVGLETIAADVEPDRGVEGDLLVEQEVGELGVEGGGVGGRGEVSVAEAPVADGLCDAGDEGADTTLALGVPTWPCRYLEATMLVAVMDQSEGTSTFFCSKMVRPL